MGLKNRILSSIRKNPNRTARQISKCFDGSTIGMVRSIADEHNFKLLPNPCIRRVKPPEPVYKESELIEELKRQLSKKDREMEEYRRGHGSIRAAIEEMTNAIPRIAPKPILYKPQKGTVSSLCSAMAHFTDWHHGANQQPMEIEGINEYSPAICEKRIMTALKKILDWTELHRTNYKIPEIVIPVTGDLISGDIHPELVRTNEWPAPQNAIETGTLLAKAISFLAPHYERVVVQFLVADNHSRLVKKPQSKEEGLNSYNYVVGCYAKKALERIENVEFNIYPMIEKIISVRGRQYLITHGHSVRGWGGIPWYGLERKLSQESTARMSLIMEDITRAKALGFHKILFGHFHTAINLGLYMGGPAISGTDAFDHKCGRVSRPGMTTWMVHPKHGEFDWTNFKLG